MPHCFAQRGTLNIIADIPIIAAQPITIPVLLARNSWQLMYTRTIRTSEKDLGFRGIPSANLLAGKVKVQANQPTTNDLLSGAKF